jgi:hypothetical protein
MGFNQKRYLKMSEDKNYEEKAVWKSADVCTLTFNKKNVVKNNGVVIGEHVETATVEAKREDMEFNLQERKDRVKKLKERLGLIEAELSKLGKKPFKTNEHVRLLKAIQDLQKIESIEKLENEEKDVQNEVLRELEFIQMRERTMKTAPVKK